MTTPWDLAEVVGGARSRMRDVLPKHALRVDLAPGPTLILADGMLPEQALVNVLDNAATDAPAGTEIVMTARTRGPWSRSR